MTKRWLINLALVVVLAALAVVVWLDPGAEPQAPKTYITTLTASDVHTIRIEQPGRKTAVFKHGNDGWRMVEPIAFRADSTLIHRWLSSIREVASRHYPVKGLDLSKFGLKPPKLTLTLNHQQIAFGGSDPIEHKRYIRRGDTIFLVDDTLFYQLRANPLSFVSKRLLPEAATITAIELPDFTITKSKNGDWALDPEKPAITSDEIQHLIDVWERAQAFNVKAAGSAESTGKVIIHLKERQDPIVFRVLEKDSLLSLVRPDLGIEYQLPANKKKDMLRLAPKQAPSSSRDTKQM